MTNQEAAEILQSEHYRWLMLARLDERQGHTELASACREIMEALDRGTRALEEAHD